MSNKTWLDAIKDEIQKPNKSQRIVAQELGISPSKLSQTLRGIYPGSTEDIRVKAEGLYMTKRVYCPALNREILVNECAENQKKPFSSANRERIKLYKACRSGCQHSELEQSVSAKPIEVAADRDDIYNLDNQLSFLKREAKGNPLRLNEMLEAELRKLAAKHNQLLWKTKYQKL
ncbi:hypothetical protein [Vibrio nigripulchritudo]|uniref:hypothetical protein n=1 Tax=Vibrio nigripulchritudo TaxID=28173 RepID=UPI0003B20D21|nr:hypothetical protein [Vibrio nigripulchritudo]CCN69754.1 conserved hypothetical protein [Vibrio nigripulchritudo SFn118]